MQARLKHFQVNPNAMQAMLALSQRVHDGPLELSLQELVKIRASQINGCAFCLHMHARDARAAGETEMRIHLLPAWRESTLYSPRERAALAWTEALLNIAAGPVSDEDYALIEAQFSPQEQVELSLLVATINAWNILNVGFRTPHPVDTKSDLPQGAGEKTVSGKAVNEHFA